MIHDDSKHLVRITSSTLLDNLSNYKPEKVRSIMPSEYAAARRSPWTVQNALPLPGLAYYKEPAHSTSLRYYSPLKTSTDRRSLESLAMVASFLHHILWEGLDLFRIGLSSRVALVDGSGQPLKMATI